MVLALPAVWLWARALAGAYPEPVKVLEHEFGLLALQLLIAALCVTPILHQTRINLVRFRRMIGLMAFWYLVMHFAVWLLLDSAMLWAQITKDLTRRPYIIVGMLALLMLVPVAVTSNDRAVRRLSTAAWRRVHWWVYPATILGGVHYLMQSKTFSFTLGAAEQGIAGGADPRPAREGASVPVEPALYLAAILALVA